MSDQQSPERAESAAPERATADPPGSGMAAEVGSDPSQFSSVAMHFYRGETDRMATWRTRLDQTTNWAVVVMAAILTWAFSSSNNPHYVILIGALAVGAFLFIEANRYQEYDAWRARVRAVEEDFLAPAFASVEPTHADWREQLGRDLQNPRLELPIWKAVGHRLHRVYFLLLSVLLASWVVRVTVFEAGTPWQQTAAITGVSGSLVALGVGFVYLVLAVLTAWSVHHATKREFGDTDVGSSLRRGG